ncbi:hypothetical protein PHYC_00229 [Phycisphaerales bacterium]|nr:hypothetical protein PHYC_00229 [Phycisphaerales bacterium]
MATTSKNPPLTNPAGRLWNLVNGAREFQNKPVQEGIAGMFGVSPKDHAGILRSSLNFVQLVAEVERLVKCVPDIDPEKHLAWTGRVRDGFQHLSLNGHQFSNVLQTFDGSAMALLSICSDHLERFAHEPIADQNGVRRLLDETLALISAVANSGIDAFLREYLLRHLQIVADALFDFRTKGFEALWNGLSTCNGHEAAAKVRVGFDPEAVQKSEFWPRVVKVVAGLVVLVDGAQRIDYVLEKGQTIHALLTDSHLLAGVVDENSLAPDAAEGESNGAP